MNQKLEFNTAINLFEDEFKNIKKGIESRGYRSEWVSKVPAIDENSYFLSKGKSKTGVKSYLSDCPHYNGIYLCSGAGALDCNLVSEHLPGIIQDLHCSKEHNKCPLKTHVKYNEAYECVIDNDCYESENAYEDPNAWNEADMAMLFGNNSFIKEVDCKPDANVKGSD